MRKFDHNGMILAEYQGKLFEKSTEFEFSTAVFLRRFLHSDLVKKIDTNDAASLSLDVDEGMRRIQDQFGEIEYGKNRYSKSALFWIGYIYRYISYTREIATKHVMKLFPHRQLNDVYYSFHTQDPEWCLQNLLEINGQSEDIFDNNLRLKAVISARGGY